MGWTTAQILAWVDEAERRAEERSYFEWLEMVPSASSLAIQNAYHAIARTRHPDLVRKQLGTRDYDRLVRMYSRVTGAYAALRPPDAAARYLRERRDSQRMAVLTPPMGVRTTTGPISTRPVTGPLPLMPQAPPPPEPPPAPPPPPGPIDPSRAMNPRALAYYRRAEGALRTGDRSTALLQIRMAIAADPRSTLLRAALAELMQP